jgi:hypothetical protein
MPKVQTYSRTITNANILKVTVGTNGPCGGDSGHGGRVVFRLEDEASTDIRVRVIEPNGGNGGVEIILGGDAEAETFIEALEWAAKVLRAQQKLNDTMYAIDPNGNEVEDGGVVEVD